MEILVSQVRNEIFNSLYSRIFSKKSQIFIFDMIFAFVVFIVSIGLFYSYYVGVDENINIYDLNMNVLNGFTNTRINALNDKEIREFFIANKIRNIENTVAQQVVEFYVNNKDNPDDAKKLTRIFIEDYLDKQMNFRLTLENESGVVENGDLYFANNRPDIPFENATITTSSSRLIFGFENQTHFYGPYIFKVRIWK